jgi:hypothetical protein
MQEEAQAAGPVRRINKARIVLNIARLYLIERI